MSGSRTRACRSSISRRASSRWRSTRTSSSISFNGEIFNYVELRAELVGARLPVSHPQRHRGRGPGVSGAWGERAFERFNGQFAIAVWRCARPDLAARARPARGAAAVHLRARGAGPGSRARSRRSSPRDPDDPASPRPRRSRRDVHVLDGARTALGVPRGRGAATGARPDLQPARDDRALLLAPAAIRSMRRLGSRGSIDEAAEALRAALETATSLRCCARTSPVGCYLSGGLDSSLVAALARRAHGDRLRTFSLRFKDAEYDETAFQREMVKLLGSDHSRGRGLARATSPTCFPRRSAHIERPILRTAPAPLLLLSRLVRDAGSRWCSPARAPTRCSRATICFARPGSAGSGRASRTRRRDHGSSTASIRTSRDRPRARERWLASSSAET